MKVKIYDFANLNLCVPTTSLQIEVKKIYRRLLGLKRKLGLKGGPAIFDKNRKLLESRNIDAMTLELLNEYQHERMFYRK